LGDPPGLRSQDRDATEPAFVGAMSSVYIWAQDAWRLALYQQTELPDAAS